MFRSISVSFLSNPLQKEVKRATQLVFLLCVLCAVVSTRKPSVRPSRNYFAQQVDVATVETNGTWVETVGWHPRAFIVHNILTADECEHIVDLGRTSLQPSGVYNRPGQRRQKQRTSSGTFLMRYRSRTLATVVERVSLLVGFPVFQGELVQLLHYEVGQYYKPHHDYFWEPNPRAATVLLYLSEVEEGGETNFPLGHIERDYKLNHNGSLRHPNSCNNGIGDIDGKGSKAKGDSVMRVRPKRGSALVFWGVGCGYMKFDELSLHEGCPVEKGDKWSSTICKIRLNCGLDCFEY